MNRENMLRLLARTVPLSALPDGQVVINGLRRQANRSEREELFVRNCCHKMEKSLNKYNPLRRFQAFLNNLRAARIRNDLNCAVGKIALAHASIEQGLKDVIISDWDVATVYPSDQLILSVVHRENFKPQPGNPRFVSDLFGQTLKKNFFKILRELKAPQQYVDRYKELYDAFEKASQLRNEALKSIYSLDENTQRLSRVKNWELQKMWRIEDNYDEVVSKWMTPVDITEFEEIAASLQQIHIDFIRLRDEIMRDKMCAIPMEVGDNVPFFALKNPFLFLYLEKMSKPDRE